MNGAAAARTGGDVSLTGVVSAVRDRESQRAADVEAPTSSPRPDCTIVSAARSDAAESAEVLEFRKCRLVPAARLLLRERQPVALGSRAFDLLHVLLRARGRVVSKDEIVREVWPQTTVEESNLRFQMASLRRALGSDRDLVKTIPGRGYLFAADPGGQAGEPGGEIVLEEAVRDHLSGSQSQRRERADQPVTLDRLASLLQLCILELRQIRAGAADHAVEAPEFVQEALRGP